MRQHRVKSQNCQTLWHKMIQLATSEPLQSFVSSSFVVSLPSTKPRVKLLLIEHTGLHYGSTRCLVNQIYYFLSMSHTHSYSPSGLNPQSHIHTHTHQYLHADALHTKVSTSIRNHHTTHSQSYTPFPPDCRHSTPSTAVKTQGLPTQQQLDDSGGPEEDGQRRRHDAELTLLKNLCSKLDLCRWDLHSLLHFFFPSIYSFLSFMLRSNALLFLHSIYLHLSFAPGTALCCPTSALITAPGRPPSTSRLACESTRPRAVITQKSSKSGHVKLREVFREPTQVSEGVS